MNRSSLLAVLGWLAVAAGTTVTSTWAISLLGEGLSQRVVSPMSEQQVAAALAGAASAGPAPPPSATPAPSPSGTRVPSPSGTPAEGGGERVFTTAGGSVVARCDGGLAVLRSWSPAQGYAVDDVDRGPAETASLEFESDTGKVKVRITCRSGLPDLSTEREDETD